MRIALAIDLGQQRDPSAIAVCERREQRTLGGMVLPPSVHATHLQRLPLGTSYRDVVEHVAQLARRLYFLDPAVVLDAGGPGRPVIDELRARGVRNVIGVQATGGNAETRIKVHRLGGESWNVSKVLLLKGLASLVYSGRLKIALLAEAPQLLQELADLELRVSAAGRETFEVGGDGSHHADLVSAVALAAWRVQQRRQVIRAFRHNLGVS